MSKQRQEAAHSCRPAQSEFELQPCVHGAIVLRRGCDNHVQVDPA
ncbi:MAG TPA: hypothetical protein VIT90_15270 [Lysobacter sp.]